MNCDVDSIAWNNPGLNNEQKLAVSRVLQGRNRPYPHVVFGPPGINENLVLMFATCQLLSLWPFIYFYNFTI